MKIKANKEQLEQTTNWFRELRNQIKHSYEEIEAEYAKLHNLEPAKFEQKDWQREGGGGGEISIMKGNVFEKVGVNISTVHGDFSDKFASQIPGTEDSKEFFATGISLVAHPYSPLVPAAHFNTRFISTQQIWFGGGGDLTPTIIDDNETSEFHSAFKQACDKHHKDYYKIFKEKCDDYFFLPHRNEARGVGGIFYDYLKNDFESDFAFTQDVGKAFRDVYPKLVSKKMNLNFTDQQKDQQLIKRGRYAEFNLIHDRGTKFGLMTGGNIEAILMSLPPVVKWP